MLFGYLRFLASCGAAVWRGGAAGFRAAAAALVFAPVLALAAGGLSAGTAAAQTAEATGATGEVRAVYRGTDGADGGGVTLGAVYMADIASVTLAAGTAAEAANLQFRWEKAAESDGAWSAITDNATGQYYTLPADFAPARFLRVAVFETAAASATLFSPAITIARETTGSLSAAVVGGGEAAVGSRITVRIDGLADGNGGPGAVVYRWLRGGAIISARVGTVTSEVITPAYNLTAEDILALRAGNFAVSVSYTDALGFVAVRALTISVETAPFYKGTAGVSGNGVYVGAVYTVDISNLTDTTLRAAPAASLAFQWQTSDVRDAAAANWSDINGATGASYTVAAADFSPAQYLRAQIFEAGGSVLVTAARGVKISRDPTATLDVTVALLGAASVYAGGTVEIRPGNLDDANGAAALWFQWLHDGSVAAGAGGATSTTLFTRVLSEADVTALTTGVFGLSVIYTDDLGFVQAWTVAAAVPVSPYAFSPLEQQQIEQVAHVFAALDAAQAAGAVGAQLDAPPLLDSGGAVGNFVEINGAEVSSRRDIARALLNEAGGDTVGGAGGLLKPRSFSLRRAAGGGREVGDVADWTMWASGGFLNLEGSTEGGAAGLTYEGNGEAYYGGVDAAIWEQSRAGLAAGFSEVDIEADLGGGATDAIRREMGILLPYWQMADKRWQLRGFVGLGEGKQELKRGGETPCTATGDVKLFFSGMSGELVLTDDGGGWQTRAAAEISQTSGETTAATCRGEEGRGFLLPPTETNGGEWSAGGAVSYLPARDNGLGVRAELGANMRGAYGDVDNDFAYDVVWDMRAEKATGKWMFAFGFGGKAQLNDTQNRRYGGVLRGIIQRGSYRNILRAARGKDGALLRRWQFGYAGQLGRQTINGDLYAEQGKTAKLGGEMRVNF